ncbi:MAG: hypothetical protein A2V81_05035 [Candidatus Abawacabacteria bacterium RBG_16_42_10]|uniref:SLH domain-containing protein n=1 Tax=Candidatus Abawacabacteria bacterium RBG_16_42_10 TaxID=1817814 RepID=A0A1F4XJ15_9BACT|nr:MAG: hypothetical protein A2V81_05035 [Candidatus Abawacabacteria bacterium RBG_16_42_10]
MKRLCTAFLIVIQVISSLVLIPLVSASNYPDLTTYVSLQSTLPGVMTGDKVNALQEIASVLTQTNATKEALELARTEVDNLITYFDVKAKELLPELSNLAVAKNEFDEMVLDADGKSKEACVVGMIYHFESYVYCFDKDSYLNSFLRHLNAYGNRKPTTPVTKDFLSILNLLTDLSKTWSLIGTAIKEFGTSTSTPTPTAIPTISPVSASILAVNASETEMPFTDVSGDYWAKTYIETLWKGDIVKGRTASTFAPDATVTRAELVKMVVLANHINVSDLQDTDTGFTDVPASHGLAAYIAYAAEHGWVKGSNGNFSPDRPVTRFEAVKIILNAFAIPLIAIQDTTFSDVADGEQSQYVETARVKNIVRGYSESIFGTNRLITRAEVSKIIALLLVPAI